MDAYTKTLLMSKIQLFNIIRLHQRYLKSEDYVADKKIVDGLELIKISILKQKLLISVISFC